MATSGSTSVAVTSYDSLVFSWQEVSQSVSNNSTTISWEMKLVSSSAGAIISSVPKKWSVTVNGVLYSGKNYITINDGSSVVLASGTTTIAHNSDGTKTFSYTFSQEFAITFAGTYISTKSGSGSGKLDTISRKSSLTVSNGTLGTAMTLTVSRKSTGFTHTITYACGSASGTICTKSTSTSISWTPPNELASQAPNANSVSVKFTITTYNGSASLGSVAKSITCAIPYTNTFVPVLLPSISDASGYANTYGAFVQGRSKLKVDITTYGAYGATIASVQTVFEGSTYTETDVTTNAIVGSGKLTVKITVTDSRGRKSEVNPEITVLPYSYPKITALSATRCDADGKPNSSGAYLLAKFSASVSSLDSKNAATYYIGYKKSTEANHTAVELTSLAGKYAVTDGTYVFPADVASSHTVIFTVTDAFKSTTSVVTGASVKKVWSALKKAGEIVGWAWGKFAELEDVFDIAWQTRFSGGILHSVLEDRTDVNTLLTPKTYMLLSANSYSNVPESGVGAFLEIVGIKDGSLIQRYSIFDRANPRMYERIHYAGTGFGEWICIRGDFVVSQGVTNGWTWRKWNSGVAECWKTLTHTTTITTGWGSFYHGTATTRQSYPFSFVDKPIEQVSLTAGSYQAILFPEKNGDGANGASASACYNVCRPSSITSSMEFYIAFNVKGKWK